MSVQKQSCVEKRTCGRRLDKTQITYRAEQGESKGLLHAVLKFFKWASAARGM